MTPLNRRRFLLTAAAAGHGLRSLAQASTPSATVVLDTAHPGALVPADFVGLSFEIQELTDPHFFSAANAGLVAQFRALAPRGVLRLGGNTSDVGWWKPMPDSPKPLIQVRSDAEGGEPTQDSAFSIEPDSVRSLRTFLDATDWRCAFGINLGSNTPSLAADQAAFVAQTLGSRLLFFQLGNEPDLFSRHLRDPARWTADAFFDEWIAAASAVRARVPDARFSLPDTSGKPKWYATCIARLTALPPAQRPRLASLSHHYYFGGPPSNPAVNVDRLLQPDPKVLQFAQDANAACAQYGEVIGNPLRPRMTEGNTCYRGGKPGVSDVFGSALWAADYCLLLASQGYTGVNIHGGSGQMVANSLGGTLPGELLMPDPHAPHPRPFYTPINGDAQGYTAEPIFYGLKFAAEFNGCTILPVRFARGDVNATAYAARLPGGKTQIAIINKDGQQDLPVHLPGYSLVLSLRAPSLQSRSATLARQGAGTRATSVGSASAALFRSDAGEAR